MTLAAMAASKQLKPTGCSPIPLDATSDYEDSFLIPGNSDLEEIKKVNKKIEAKLQEQDESSTVSHLLIKKFIGNQKRWLDVMETDVPLPRNLKSFPVDPTILPKPNSNLCKQPTFKPISQRKKSKNQGSKAKVYPIL